MQKSNLAERLKAWASWATSLSQESLTLWEKELREMNIKDYEEMLNFLAGYFGATNETKTLMKRLIEKKFIEV